MFITRLYSDQDGETHFESIEITLKESGIIGALSERYSVKDLIFRENTPDYYWDFHCAPEKQFLVLLSGKIEITVSDGQKAVFCAGDVLLLEDVSGKGHRTKAIHEGIRRTLFITVED